MSDWIARPRAGRDFGVGCIARMVTHASAIVRSCRPQAGLRVTRLAVHILFRGAARAIAACRPHGGAFPNGTPRRIQHSQPRPRKGRLGNVVHLPAGPIRCSATAHMVSSMAANILSLLSEHLAAPATFDGASVTSVTIVSVVLARKIVGIGATPVATPRRIQDPQPLPRGRLGGVVHLPAGTTGVDASAPCQMARLSILTSTRLGRWQPRHNGRLAISLQLPLQDDVTTFRTFQHARCPTYRHAAAHSPEAVVDAVPPTVVVALGMLRGAGCLSVFTDITVLGVALDACTNPPADFLDSAPRRTAAAIDRA
jgi:hypothetical protein